MTYQDNDPGHTNAHNDHVNQINAALASVATKADAGHGHGEAEITNLVTDLADHSSRIAALEAGGGGGGGGGGGVSLPIAESDVTNLVTDLAGKAPTNPWQFKVEDHGALGDGMVASDVATNGTSTFTSATIAANAAVGQYVMINGGRGTADTAAIGQITAINTGTNAVTINAPTLPINVTASNLNAVFGTDDQAAINSAFAAAKTYAEAHDYFAEVLFKDKIYVLASPPTQTANSPAFQNSQLPIPFPTNNNGRKLVFGIKGVARADHYQYWNQTVPAISGTALVSMTTAPSAIDGTFGPQSVLGGPTGQSGFLQGGTIATAFANVKPVVENIQIVCPVYTNMTAFDFTYVTGFYADGCSAHVFAQPLSGGGPLLSSIWTDGAVFGTRAGVGMRFPAGGNNADNTVPSFVVEGYNLGVLLDEHAWIGNLRAIYVGVVIKMGPNTQGHATYIGRVTAEAYQGGILTQSSGTFPIFVGVWATEDSATAYDINDSGNQLTGEIHWSNIVDSRGPAITGATRLRIVNDKLGPGKWTTAPAVPASTVNAQNTAWRDAAVVVSGGTVTAITVDGVAQGVTSGMVLVPSGKNIAITYSVAPTWKWTLL
jgi:hypothetical protein